MFQLVIIIGILVVSFINYGIVKVYFWGWCFFLGLVVVFVVLFMLGGFFCFEIFNSLIE